METRTGWRSVLLRIKGEEKDYRQRGMEARVYLRSPRSGEGQGVTVGLFSILNNLILVSTETVVEKEPQFNRAILRHYSLFTPGFKHGERNPWHEAGFEATGIWPVQPSSVLNELFQPEAPQQSETPPSTQLDRLFWTLTSRRDISQIARTLLDSISSDHTYRYLLR